MEVASIASAVISVLFAATAGLFLHQVRSRVASAASTAEALATAAIAAMEIDLKAALEVASEGFAKVAGEVYGRIDQVEQQQPLWELHLTEASERLHGILETVEHKRNQRTSRNGGRGRKNEAVPNAYDKQWIEQQIAAGNHT